MKQTREEYHAQVWQKDDPKPAKEAAAKRNKQTFWGICVPIGGVAAFVLTLVTGEAGVFFPAWAVLSLILWGIFSGLEEKR